MTEQAIQRAIAAYLDVALPDDCFYSAVNPVPAKTKAAAGISKAMGVKAGVPDLVLCHRGDFICLEVKKEGGYLSQVQKQVIQQIRDAGGIVYTVRSVEDVEQTLKELGIELRGSVAA